MPYYFIEEVNTLAGIQTNTLKTMIEIVNRITGNPLLFLPPEGTSSDVRETLESLTKSIWRANKYFNMFKEVSKENILKFFKNLK